jgi:ribosomal protein L24E
MASCKYCGKEVTWLQEGRKKVPVEGDGTVHACEEYKKARKSFKKIEVKEIDPDILKQYEDAMNKKK